jgi:ribosome-associated heat shock protein Hsp15
MPASEEASAQRLDKWLWFARVVKSRTLAAHLIEAGKVRVNRARAQKPSQVVHFGDVLTIGVHARVRVLKVLALGLRRGPPVEARGLYDELTVPVSVTAQASTLRERGAGRPTKRDRRRIDRLRSSD